MTTPRDDRDRLDAGDHAFVDELRASYDWPDASDAERAAFRARLEERIDGPAPRAWLWPAGALLAAAAIAVIWLSPTGPQTQTTEQPIAHIPDTLPSEEQAGAPTLVEIVVETPEDALIALTSTDELDFNESLPDDYEAISALFLGET